MASTCGTKPRRAGPAGARLFGLVEGGAGRGLEIDHAAFAVGRIVRARHRDVADTRPRRQVGWRLPQLDASANGSFSECARVAAVPIRPDAAPACRRRLDASRARFRPTAGEAWSTSRRRREPRSTSVKSRAPGWTSATRHWSRTSWQSSRGRRWTSPTMTTTNDNVFSLSTYQIVRPRAVCRRPLEVGQVRSSGDRPGLLRHPLAHERLHSRLHAPALRRDRRRGPAIASTTCRRAPTP